jgi:predicted small metal-binding protein
LFAIANSNAEVVKKVVVKYGYEHTKDIRKADYDKICGEIEEEVSNNA